METVDLKNLRRLCRKYKLLYVEDDDLARETSLELFSNFFNNIDTAKNGQDGLEKFKSSSYDLIITDIKMPKLDGIEMFRAIRDIDSDIPVLFLSAHNEASFFVEAIKLNVSGYILKPLDIEQFTTQISKSIREIELKEKSNNYKEKLENEVYERTLELDRKLHYDSTTNLLNRYSFFEKIYKLQNPVVFVIDIDRFKFINEFYGDSIGTFVLKEFARFLLSYVKNTNFEVFRLSADKFILLQNNQNIDINLCKEFTKKLLVDISNIKIIKDSVDISIDVSIGISTVKEHILEKAEIALNHAKKYKKSFVIYNDKIANSNNIKDAIKYKKIIKDAISNNMVTPVYQAIVDSDTKVQKYEILMRIKDKDGKLISPFFFLDIAIKTKLYKDLSAVIVFSALNKLKEDETLSLSINFTYDDIKNEEFIDEIAFFMSLNTSIGNRAIFEITENQSIENYEDVKNFIKRFRNYGVKFAIDDFGSGFSNFEYILEIEPDFLKIDGSLVKNIDTDKKSYILVKAIVQFSHELGIKVIAEYVYNEKIFLLLKAMGVDGYQGYYFSEPSEKLL